MKIKYFILSCLLAGTIFFVGAINSFVFSQFSQKIYHTREVIIDNKDSIIRVNILAEKIELEISNDLVYYWYRSDQINKNLGGYSEYLLHGQYRVFNKAHSLITEGCYKLGLKNGIWKKWNSKGGLLTFVSWEKGKLDGVTKIYNKYGKLVLLQNYKTGLLNGLTHEYKADTIIKRNYKNGIEIIITDKEKEGKLGINKFFKKENTNSKEIKKDTIN